jgi:hypothetical protein
MLAVLLLLPAGASVTGEPKLLLSTTNCTLPVGAAFDPAEPSLTVAVKVTDWPLPDGFKDDATVVEVAAAVTVKDALLLLVEWTASAG